MPSNEDYDWIFDFVMQFLESDRFDSAVMDFVDEKCFVFEDVEENRFIYTDIHREFRDHIEALISSNLGELGITTELFFESCENGRNNRDINKQVFERMIAMEDFETFKKLMTKRNMELQLETIRLYNTARSSRTEKRTFMKEEQEVADALEASLRSSESERIKLPVPEELKALLDSETRHPDDRLGSIRDSEMQEILHRSLLEMEILHRQAEMEQADLEQAVALSLTLEEERLRQLLLDEKKSSPCLQRQNTDGDKDYDVKGSRAPSESKNSDRVHEIASAKGSDRLEVSQEDTSKDSRSIGSNNKDSQRRTKIGPSSSSRNEGLSDLAAPKPLQGRPLGFNSLTALPSIASGADALENKKREAEDEIRRGQEQLSEQRKHEAILRKQLGHVNQEDAEERRKHMAEQRDKILSLKKEERRKKVVVEDELQVKDIDVPKGVSRLKTHDEEKAASQDSNVSPKHASSMDEKKRSAMRLALARRMKLDLIEGEENKLALRQENQFAELDRKLQQVNDLRIVNKQREKVLAEQVSKQQDVIAKNVISSAQNLRI